MKKTGVCPVASKEVLQFTLNTLREKGALKNLPEETYGEEAEALAKLLPDHYFPDIYLDLPLMGGDFRGMAAVLDCYERCYLDFNSEGEYFKNTGLPALNAPERRDDLLVFRTGDSGAEFFMLNKNLSLTDRQTESEKDLSVVPGLSALYTLPLKYRKESLEDGFRLTVTTGIQSAKKRFAKKPWKDTFLQMLLQAGCDEANLRALDNASFNCGVPFLHPLDGYMEWIVCLDVAAFTLTVRGSEVCDCHAVIRISDKCLEHSGFALGRMHAYQWHITDNCDQRCKHCYLFAEDARMKCVTTPWDDLTRTLDATTEDAAERGALPLLAISGGDPLLHPEFWRFAEELHRRGIRWTILGNPFHLNEEVCRRLYQLGCFKYQMSLDGLEPFHDSMRKPGSYKATLEAIPLLNNAGIQSQLMATASRLNLEDILAIMDVAVEHQVSSFAFARYCATSPEKAEDYPSPEEYRDFLYRYYRKAKEYEAKNCPTRFHFKEHLFTLVRYELGEFEPSEYSKEHPDWIFDGCHLGQGCAILANGDLMACRRMESVIGNMKTDNLSEVLKSDLCLSYRDIQNIKKCKDCELHQWCRGCRAVGFNATGDVKAADPCCWKE